MAVDIRADFSGGLNLDDSPYVVLKNSYVDAVNITRDAVAGSADRVLSNIVGNQQFISSPSVLPPGQNIVIGSYPNTIKETVIYFVWNEYGKHLIAESNFATGTTRKILLNLDDTDNVDILGFSSESPIHSINVYNGDDGDLLYFIDTLKRPTYIDVERLASGEYSPVTRELIEVIKRPPLYPLTNIYTNDASLDSNFLYDRLFRFKYRYVYDNNERSVCSPISIVPLPENVLDLDYEANINNNNTINLVANTGDQDVKAIELLMSYVNRTNDWSDFALIDIVKKDDTILLNEKHIVTEEFVEDIPYQSVKISFYGYIIPEGTIINVSYKSPLQIIGTYTTLVGDTLANIAAGLAASINLLGAVTATHIPGSSYIVISNFGTLKFFENIFIQYPSGYSIDNNPFTYGFKNDGTYPYIDINESILLYDYVPRFANTQELANGNVLLYGGIREGYDKDLNPDVANTILTVNSGFAISNTDLSYNLSVDADYDVFKSPNRRTYNYIQLLGNPKYINGIGTDVEVFWINEDVSPTPSLLVSVTSELGDTYNDILLKIWYAIVAASPAGLLSIDIEGRLTNTTKMNVVFSGNNSGIKYPRRITSLNIITPGVNQSKPTFLYQTQRKIGIAYFDQYGRTNGILYSDKLSFPKYSEDLVTFEMKLPYINTKIWHLPPIWAHSYGFYLTKENTQFLYWLSIGYVYDSEFGYFNISNLQINQERNPTTTQVVSYSFKPGDRIRIIKQVSSNDIYNYEAYVLGVLTNPGGTPGSTGTWVKFRMTSDISTAALPNEKYIIQLYTPQQQTPSAENEVYYEFGQQYSIGNPGTGGRYHYGMVRDQSPIPDFNIALSYVPQTNVITLFTCAGVIVAGIVISVSIFEVASSNNVSLFTYTTLQGDTPQNVAYEINQLMQAYVGTYIVSSSIGGQNNIVEVETDSNQYTFDSNNIVIDIPANLPQTPAEFNFYDGDVYFKGRVVTVDATSASHTAPETYFCLDRNFTDNYISAVNSIDGRPNIIDNNAKDEYFGNLIRFGQAIQENTNINNLNRFYPLDYDIYDYNYGDIMRLKTRDRFIRVFQKLKVGMVPLYQQMVKNKGSENLVVSDKLLNPINYYQGDVGIGNLPSSLASYSYDDYFASDIRGVIAKVGQDGVRFLSVDKKVNSWASAQLPSRANSMVSATFNNILGTYILYLPYNGLNEFAITYNTAYDNFESFLTLYPESMTCLGTILISFKDGILYTHNNPDYNTFFGLPAAESSVSVVFNESAYQKKTFLAMSEVASDLWDVPSIKTDLGQESDLVTSDFELLEGTYESSIKRDANSPGGVIDGDILKGKYLISKFRKGNASSLVTLNILSLKYIDSPLTNR